MNGLVEWVSQPSIKIEMQSNTVNGKCSQWKNNILFKNETEKNCVITSERFTQIIVKFETENFFCTFLSSTKHPFEGQEILCVKYGLAPL